MNTSVHSKDTTGTTNGTLYMAPEVFRSEGFDCKADIYSLGIMLWEMWYGQQAFAIAPVKNLEVFFALIDGGSRPEHVKDSKRPPARWKRLMNQCWNRNPEERPTAAKCYDKIITLSTAVVIPVKVTFYRTLVLLIQNVTV